MKKKIIRSSMIAVAAMSIMLGGTSYTTSVKDEVRETPAVISKAIANSVADSKEISKGIALNATTESVDVAETTEAQATEVESSGLEEKEVKLESNQVVANIDSFLNIRTEPSEEAEVVGKFYRGNVGTVIEKGEEWSVVASGNAYGYVHNDYLLFGEAAEAYIENNCDQVAKVATETLNVRAEESTESDILTLTDQGSTFTILGNENGWVKVALDEEQVGYVSSDYVYIDYVYETAVTIEEEQAAIAAAEAEAQAAAEAAAQAAAEAAAQEQQQQEQQQQQTTQQEPSTQAPTTEAPKQDAVTSTDVKVEDEDTSKETVKQESSSTTGQAIADYAVQFVGNPYVYGGTSLTNGADCSGFVQSVYKHFGYSLPRTAASQAGAGRQVSLDSLQPGDLLFYHGYGHVAIYIGGGQVVHASNKKTGIKISSYNYSPINKAVRIVK